MEDANNLYLAARAVRTSHGMIHVQRAGLQKGLETWRLSYAQTAAAVLMVVIRDADIASPLPRE